MSQTLKNVPIPLARDPDSRFPILDFGFWIEKPLIRACFSVFSCTLTLKNGYCTNLGFDSCRACIGRTTARPSASHSSSAFQEWGHYCQVVGDPVDSRTIAPGKGY